MAQPEGCEVAPGNSHRQPLARRPPQPPEDPGKAIQRIADWSGVSRGRWPASVRTNCDRVEALAANTKYQEGQNAEEQLQATTSGAAYPAIVKRESRAASELLLYPPSLITASGWRAVTARLSHLRSGPSRKKSRDSVNLSLSGGEPFAAATSEFAITMERPWENNGRRAATACTCCTWPCSGTSEVKDIPTCVDQSVKMNTSAVYRSAEVGKDYDGFAISMLP